MRSLNHVVLKIRIFWHASGVGVVQTLDTALYHLHSIKFGNVLLVVQPRHPVLFQAHAFLGFVKGGHLELGSLSETARVNLHRDTPFAWYTPFGLRETLEKFSSPWNIDADTALAYDASAVEAHCNILCAEVSPVHRLGLQSAPFNFIHS
jgi:hypothetical protein